MSRPRRRSQTSTTRATLALALLALGLFTAPVFGAECTDCHSGQNPKAPKVHPAETSVHAGLECEDCHGGVTVKEGAAKPHGDNVRAVKCQQCHEDQYKTFTASSHGAKMKAYFDKAGDTKPAAECLACHASDPHAIVKVKDNASPMARGNTAATCLKCHEKNQFIAVSAYTDSVHGAAVAAGKTKAAVCTDCHGGHGINRSNLDNSSVSHTNIPQTCGKCHPAEYTEYTSSYHWLEVTKGYREAPVCTDCHGEHNIRSHRDPKSTVYAGNVTKTCVGCHGSERMNTKFMTMPGGVESLQESFHGISSSIGDVRVANCSSCHGNHLILPRSDPRSSVNPANLGRTCGACHPGAETRFINEHIHTSETRPSHWIVGIAQKFYIWMILLTIGGMLFHNLLDLRYKSMCGLPYHKNEIFEMRFTINERIQHALLAACFIVLAWSGLAREYPNSLIGWPFRFFPSEMDVRGLIHRVAAVLFIALAFYHLVYLIATRRGRQQLNEMRPKPQDAFDAKNTMLKYLGLNKKPQTLPHYGYVEKAEYWALVWGTFIMSVTGLILWFVNRSLTHLPLWTVDLAVTIHFWEALLAVLAILVWHGYWVIFDPEYYPLNLTWLIGRPRHVKPVVTESKPAGNVPVPEAHKTAGE